MVLNPSVPAHTVPEFIAYAADKPSKINVASAGNGTPSHMASVLFGKSTGLDLFVVHYRGGAPALADLIAGHVRSYSTTCRPPLSTSDQEKYDRSR